MSDQIKARLEVESRDMEQYLIRLRKLGFMPRFWDAIASYLVDSYSDTLPWHSQEPTVWQDKSEMWVSWTVSPLDDSPEPFYPNIFFSRSQFSGLMYRVFRVLKEWVNG